MDYGKVAEGLVAQGTLESLNDALSCCIALEKDGEMEVLSDRFGSVAVLKNSENSKKAHTISKDIRKSALLYLKAGRDEAEDLYWQTILFDAPVNFDCFCRYIERAREPRKRFYEPRRKQLKPLADALQKLEDNDLDLLAISLPPGIGKTTLAIFYICWTSGLHPEKQSLIGSHNNEFLRGVYDECLRIMSPQGEYLWHHVFPTVEITGTNAKDMRIDLGNKKRFQTIELSSISSGNSGKVRATNLLYCDDLVEGIEQAMSADQMEKLWSKYTVDLRQRKQGESTKELMIATRWSLLDPIGKLESIYADSERAMFINIPALDEDGESNFDYPYGLGFSTQMYEDLKNSMDDASWRALYMGEPIERSGQLYAPDELRRFYTLPEREPDAILAVCDTKEQGNDYCAMPIVYQYGSDYYVDAWICDNGKPDLIEQRIVQILYERKVELCQFESNRGGTLFATNVQNALKDRGSKCKITTRWNQTQKATRILVAAAWVKEHCLFKDETLYARADKEYRTAMKELTSYTLTGKNKHDDVPDVLADLEHFANSWMDARVTVKKRPF